MQSSYLLVNDLRYHYYFDNLRDGARPALLLHGLASNARIWEKTAPTLAAGGLAIYAPDLRGHGLTDKPDGDYSFNAFIQDLAAFMDTCDLKRPVLIGHSWGAMLALDYAARFAIGPRAPAALVLVDGGINQLDDMPGATWETVRDRLTPPRLAGVALDDFLQRLDGNSTWKPDEEDLSIILANFEIDADERVAPRLTFERHMQIVEAMWGFPTYERYSRLRCPTLALPARPAPPYSPGEAEYLALKERGLARIQQACTTLQAHWMENSIHDIPLQRPVEMAQVVLDFLAGVP
jgi:pimeloyl-ACP methyl ester carboxylesterase